MQHPEEPSFVVVLGIAQDAGFPQTGCRKECCASTRYDSAEARYPCCLAVVDLAGKQRWLFDCTPFFPQQLRMLDELAPAVESPGLAGIFLTHAHIGHYSGLMHLGREVMDVDRMPVHVMPRMSQFLQRNGPWSQLVDLRNIELSPLEADKPVRLTESLQVTPILVPHRGEFSETVAFRIDGPNRSVLYLPDIDRWEDWHIRIEDSLTTVDRAYLDGTFYSEAELPGRDFSTIPHPLITDSIDRFHSLSAEDRGKVHFFHLNHTNPALHKTSEASHTIEQAGHHVAGQGERYLL